MLFCPIYLLSLRNVIEFDKVTHQSGNVFLVLYISNDKVTQAQILFSKPDGADPNESHTAN